METQKNDFLLKKVEIEFWLVLEIWNHPSFVNISPTLVIDTSMERSSRVLYHEKSKFYFIKKKKRLTKCFCCHVFNNFKHMLCTLIGAIILSINIQVGLNMHLYDDIGDASSSLRGSTSSFFCLLIFIFAVLMRR